MEQGASQRIVEVFELTKENMDALIFDEIVLLIVKEFYPQELCQQIGEKIKRSDRVEKYTHELKDKGQIIQTYMGVDRLGVPFNMVYNSTSQSPSVSQYYASAKVGIRTLREAVYPSVSPIDKLRLELDERYFPGATVAAFEGQKMLAGIGRITKAHLSHLSEDQPHFDALPVKYASLDSQLAANIYLKVPHEGGELEIWDVPPLDPLTEVPAQWRQALPHSLKIKPQQGDLVIFNCRRPHAICAFLGEDRVTAQMFIGYQQGKPLQLWN